LQTPAAASAKAGNITGVNGQFARMIHVGSTSGAKLG
jgi:hypothetical protein